MALPVEAQPAGGAGRFVAIPPGWHVPIRGVVGRIYDTCSFRRLAHINQLALLDTVFPGSAYRRIVHVLHCFELARRLLPHLCVDSLFREIFTDQEIRIFLVAVLLHDFNHFPFLHIFQESASHPAIDLFDFFGDGGATGENAAEVSSVYGVLREHGISPDRLKRVIFGKPLEQAGKYQAADQAMNSILSGGVDVDKLSYLFLDSYFSGVRFGRGLDIPMLFQGACLVRLPASGTVHLAFMETVAHAAENAVLTRSWNFRALYWHRANRAIMAMILHVVRELLQSGHLTLRDYLLATLWRNDAEALRFLDSTFRSVVGRASILARLDQEQGRVFERLYTIHAGEGDEIEDALQAKFAALTPHREALVRTSVARALEPKLRRKLGRAVRDEEILLDIPRRKMDSGGPVYIRRRTGQVLALSEISEPVRHLSANYDRMSKRVRIFVSPEVWRAASDVGLAGDRAWLQGLLKELLVSNAAVRQIQ